MSKILKVSNAVCPCCKQHVNLDDDGKYERHAATTEHIATGLSASLICNLSGQKADRSSLREERKRMRAVQAIEKKHAERKALREKLEPEARSLMSGKSITAEAFVGLLKGYGYWDSIPPRSKGNIKDNLRCLQYSDDQIRFVMHGKRRGEKIMPFAKSLITQLGIVF
jgi:hypothetical protein